MAIQSYKDLDVWKKSIQLAELTYQSTQDFPKSETYGMVSQMRRAAVSIPSNIAEGWGRGTKEYLHFLMIAVGSCCELETQIVLSQRLKFFNQQVSNELDKVVADVSRMLKALRKSLKEKG